MNRKLSYLFIFTLTFFACVLYSDTLYGKNLYIPHSLNYSFPGFDPKSGRAGEYSISASYYGINEFLSYNSEEVAMDYESSVLETSYAYRIYNRLLLGVDIRLISYYGGFMDPLIELWHEVFSFPNGERHFFEQNKMSILFESNDYKDIKNEGFIIGIGDIDLYSVWNIFNKRLTLSLASAIKIPTGKIGKFTGSGVLDFGLQFLTSWEVNKKIELDLQQGVVIPLNTVYQKIDGYTSKIQSQTLFAFTYNLNSTWKVISQFKIHTSPISFSRNKTTDALGTMSLYTLPQFLLQVGVKRVTNLWTYQFYIEEDPFTYEGVDILFNFRISRHF